MAAFRVIFSSFLVVSALRNSRTIQPAVDTVACPVLAALVSAGHLRPDTTGRVPDWMVTEALMKTGASQVFAIFQTAGIVGYLKDDIHQATRMTGPRWKHQTDRKYFNLHTMNIDDTCTKGMSNTKAGYPCNINTIYQQHAFSTNIRHPVGRERFDHWFDDVLDNIAGVEEKVLTLEGMFRLLVRARTEGDFGGENSLNKTGGLSGSKLAKFHPSVTNPANIGMLSQWQAGAAWAGFWVAFARYENGVGYMPKSDLVDFFIKGEFPATWEKRSWGLGSIFNLVYPAFQGSGVGDDFVRVSGGVLATLGTNASEEAFYRGLAGALAMNGAFNDNVINQVE